MIANTNAAEPNAIAQLNTPKFPNKKIIPIADAQAKKALHLIEKENTKEILKQ